jgi:hypothetical protein
MKERGATANEAVCKKRIIQGRKDGLVKQKSECRNDSEAQ